MKIGIIQMMPAECPMGYENCYGCDHEESIDAIDGTVECSVKIAGSPFVSPGDEQLGNIRTDK